MPSVSLEVRGYSARVEESKEEREKTPIEEGDMNMVEERESGQRRVGGSKGRCPWHFGTCSLVLLSSRWWMDGREGTGQQRRLGEEATRSGKKKEVDQW
jgi:hypothetical protein